MIYSSSKVKTTANLDIKAKKYPQTLVVLAFRMSAQAPKLFHSAVFTACHSGGTNYLWRPRYENSNENIKSVDKKNEHSNVQNEMGPNGAEFNYQIMLSNSDR